MREGDTVYESKTSKLQRESAGDLGGSPSRPIQRRTIVKGAAWSLPVLAAAVAVPAHAASGTPCVGATYNSPGTYTYAVPAGRTTLNFEIAGGGGGADFLNAQGTTGPGGSGALIAGALAVTPGQTLTLIVGGGGQGVHKQGLGGKGFGNGGNATNVGGVWYGPASGGGAGSAILLGATPLVVAGGGGGAGFGEGILPYLVGSPTGAGSAGPNPTDGALISVTTSAGIAFTVNGGSAANGSAGGAARPASTTGNFAATLPGATGGGFGTGANGGGNGGNSNPGSNYQGAGGGGYAGGGSGGATERLGSDYTNIGGNGGAGSNFVGGPGVAVSSILSAGNGGPAGSPSANIDGGPGYVRIICP